MTRADDLTRILRSGQSARPRLIWYAPGERIELSGRVLATWVAKAADLLQEDLDAGVGTRVGLSGSPHWRLLVWALATWTLGGTVVTSAEAPDPDAEAPLGRPADGAPVDVLVADGEHLHRCLTGAWRPGDPLAWRAEHVVGLTRAALARRSPVDLPAGVLDEAAVLSSHADEMVPEEEADPADPALVSPAGTWTHADLVAAGSADRVHLSGSVPLTDVVREAVALWAAGGSLVLTDPAWESTQEADALREVLRSEGVSGLGG